MKKLIVILLISVSFNSYSKGFKSFVKENTEFSIGIGVLGSCFLLNQFVCTTEKQRQTVFLTGMSTAVALKITIPLFKPKKCYGK